MARKSRVNRRRQELWLWAVIVSGLFVCIRQVIEPPLLYYGFGVFTAYPVFSWENSFLQDAFTTPGGPLMALAALLAQTYQSPSPGALTITAVLSVLVLGVQRLLYSIQAGKFRDLAWATPVLALMVYYRCDNPLPVLLATGLSVWMAVLYEALPSRTLPTRLGAFLPLFALNYYLTGRSALVFVCIVCLIEALLHRKAMVALAETLIAAGGIYVLGRFAFNLEPLATYTIGTPWDRGSEFDFSRLSSALVLALYAFVPALVLAAFVGRILTAFQEKRRTAPQKKQGRRSASRVRPVNEGRWAIDGRLRFGLRLLVVGVAATLGLALSRSYLRDERVLHYWTTQRDWDRVIALAHRMRRRHVFTPAGVFDINRALAHQGRLGEELCAYPQDETRTLFLSFEDMAGRLQHSKLLELYLDLGCPNAAEKNVYELLDNEGSSPHVLEAMVRIHLVKGEYESAKIALGTLRKYAGGGPYVRRWQDVVADPAKAETDPLLRSWRRVRSSVDQAVAGVSFEPMLRRLLQETPDYRLAFEYLMANYLLKHQRAEFMRYLPLLKSLGYTQLPRQYAEAVLVHSLETRTPVDAQGWTIAPDVYDQFRETRNIVQAAHGDNQAVFDTLALRYGDSYIFYSMFNVCGAK